VKILRNIAGFMLLAVGGTWFLQGIGVLPGSFMSGQIRWAIYGGVAVVLGLALLLAPNSRRGGE
jgi:hypothetical protein